MAAMHSRQPAVAYPLMAWQRELPGSASKALAAGQSGQDHPVCNSFRSQQIRGTRWKKRGVGGFQLPEKNVVAEVERLASEALCLAAMQGPCKSLYFLNEFGCMAYRVFHRWMPSQRSA